MIFFAKTICAFCVPRTQDSRKCTSGQNSQARLLRGQPDTAGARLTRGGAKAPRMPGIAGHNRLKLVEHSIRQSSLELQQADQGPS